MNAGIEALRAGRSRDARRIFHAMVQQQPDNAAAWWYLSAVTDEPSQKVYCLENVLRLEPGHTAAIELLREWSPRVRSVTPPRGTVPPVLEATERTGNQIAIPDFDRDPVDRPRSQKHSPNRIGLLILAVALVIALAWLGLAIQSGFALRSLELATPTLAPTAIPLNFGVPDCLPANDDKANLVFTNETGMELTLMRGTEGREVEIGVIRSGEQLVVSTSPDAPIRFSVQVGDPRYDLSGAIIQISAANTCRVTVSK